MPTTIKRSFTKPATPDEEGEAVQQPEQIVPETPSQRVVREARPLTTIKDSRGRTIVYRALGVLDEAILARRVGAELAMNSVYMRYIRLSQCIQSIDGDPGIPGHKPSLIEARLDWAGDEACLAVFMDIEEKAKKMMAEIDAENDQPVDDGSRREKEDNDLKNL